MTSLFDGISGFCLAGARNGIKTIQVSEIEPYPIAVSKAHFPEAEHLGSITELNGAQMKPVDIITFGSPCQDLSVAGKQTGIHEGERSSLFFEAIRIIREMRDKDIASGRSNQSVRPRFAVWENVPGAFSSNQGRDFQAVLQAFCNIRGGQADTVPLPPKGRWNPAGCIVGDGWSLAWRILDAQFWGVPQRRKRIFLVADFAGERAGEILFVERRVRGHSAESAETGQGTSAHAERSAGRSGGVRCLNPWDCESKRQYEVDGVYRTLDAGNSAGGQAHGVCYKTGAFMGGQGAKARSIAYHDDGSSPTLKSAPSGGNTVPDVVYPTGADLYNGQLTGDKAATVGANSGQSANHAWPSVVYPINTMVATRGGKDDGRTTFGVGEPNDPQFTLSSAHEHGVCYAIEGNVVDRDAKQNGMGVSEDRCPTLNGQDKHAVCFQQNQREEVRDMGEQTGAISAEPGAHQQNYVCYKQDGFADYTEGVGTLKASGGDMGGEQRASSFSVFENHGKDGRYTGPMKTSQTITAYAGTGGNNLPIAVERKQDE